MDKITLKNRLLKAKDLRNVLKNAKKDGATVYTKSWYNHASNCTEYWTTVELGRDDQKIDFNWSIGEDEYDDKKCHIWGISY